MEIEFTLKLKETALHEKASAVIEGGDEIRLAINLDRDGLRRAILQLAGTNLTQLVNHAFADLDRQREKWVESLAKKKDKKKPSKKPKNNSKKPGKKDPPAPAAGEGAQPPDTQEPVTDERS